MGAAAAAAGGGLVQNQFVVQGGSMVHTGEIGTWEAEARGAEVETHPLQHSKFEASLGYMESYLKKKKVIIL